MGPSLAHTYPTHGLNNQHPTCQITTGPLPCGLNDLEGEVEVDCLPQLDGGAGEAVRVRIGEEVRVRLGEEVRGIIVEAGRGILGGTARLMFVVGDRGEVIRVGDEGVEDVGCFVLWDWDRGMDCFGVGGGDTGRFVLGEEGVGLGREVVVMGEVTRVMLGEVTRGEVGEFTLVLAFSSSSSSIGISTPFTTMKLCLRRWIGFVDTKRS